TDILGLREDVYSVAVTAGQTLDVDYYSTSFDTFLWVSKSGASIPTNRVSFLDATGHGTSRVTAHTVVMSSGTYTIEAESLFGADPVSSSLPWSGPYTLIVTLTGGTTQPPT